jgi:hypothetical protein
VSFPKPSAAVLWQAIEIYLAHAYADPLPAAVRGRLDTLRATDPTSIYESPVFERCKNHHSSVALRLGNHAFPHMKLRIDPAPGGHGFVFFADTHDVHVQAAPRSRDALLFQSLIEQNHTMAASIHSAWAAAKIPTAATA